MRWGYGCIVSVSISSNKQVMQKVIKILFFLINIVVYIYNILLFIFNEWPTGIEV